MTADASALINDYKAVNESLEVIHLKLGTLENLEGRMASAEDKINTFENTITSLQLNVNHLKNRSRRCNQIMYEILEQKNEKANYLGVQIPEKLIKSTLGITSRIKKMHHLCPTTENKTFPVTKLQ